MANRSFCEPNHANFVTCTTLICRCKATVRRPDCSLAARPLDLPMLWLAVSRYNHRWSAFVRPANGCDMRVKYKVPQLIQSEPLAKVMTGIKRESLSPCCRRFRLILCLPIGFNSAPALDSQRCCWVGRRESEAVASLLSSLRRHLPKTHRMISIARRRDGRYYFRYGRSLPKRPLAQRITGRPKH